MTKRRAPPETDKDPTEEVEKDVVLKDAQRGQQGGGMSTQSEGSNQGRSTGRKGK
jgi:hypothetical protein